MQFLAGILLVTMAVVLIAAVSYQCAATWRWLKALAKREPTAEESTPISKQPSIRISHSLPDIQKDVPNCVPEKEGGKKVMRQTTLPTVPARHQTFQRQLSHRFDAPCVQFSICRLEDRNDSRLGLIKVSKNFNSTIIILNFFALLWVSDYKRHGLINELC